MTARHPARIRGAPRWLLYMGRHTLLVFVIHAVILYGCITGQGLYRVLRYQLDPGRAVAGALLFMALHVVIVLLWSARKRLTPPLRVAASAAPLPGDSHGRSGAGWR